MPSAFTESIVEDAALAWLKALGYAVLHGPAIAVGEPKAERRDLNSGVGGSGLSACRQICVIVLRL